MQGLAVAAPIAYHVQNADKWGTNLPDAWAITRMKQL